MAIDILTLALAKKMSGSSGGSVIQSDWNQNNPTAPDYVKNRTHYTETVDSELIPKTDHTFGVGPMGVYSMATVDLVEGNTYTVMWDEQEYECICYQTGNGLAIGCSTFIGVEGFDNGEPFVFDVNIGTGATIVMVSKAGEHTFSVLGKVEKIHKLDPKYIKDMYYTETVQKSETREFDGILVDADFASLLLENRQTATYTINGVPYTFGQDEQVPTGYLWTIFSADGTIGGISVNDNDGVIQATDATSITVTYESEEIHTIDPKYLPDSVKAQPDWNASEGEPGYIKNRPFYDSTEETVLIDETITITDSYYENSQFIYEFGRNLGLAVGNSYNITFLGETFENVTYNGNMQFTLSSGATINIVDDHINSFPGDGMSRPFDADIKIWSTTEETVKLDPKYLPDSAKSDWNQNDPTAPDYIKNRPFWTGDPVEKTLFNNDFDIDNLCYDGTPLGLEIGKTYTVCLNEDSYDVVCVGIDGGCFLGNGSLQDIGEDTGEPFVVIESVDHNVFSACVAESYFIQLLESGKDPIVSLEIFGSHKEVTTIDAKYLPVGGMRRGVMSFADIVPTVGLNIFVGTTTYASFINHLQSSAIPIFYLGEHGLGGNAMTALVFSYSSSIPGEIGNKVYCVTLSVFDLTYGFSGKVYVTFPLNADNAVDDDSAVESIQFSTPESMVLKSSTVGSEKKFKITVDDSGTLKATELT